MGKFSKLLVIFVLALVAVSGCSYQSVEEVKSEKNIGKKVAVKGEVMESVKIGSLSGYILSDSNNDTIGVSALELPREGETVVARGKLKRKPIFGYYIDEKNN